MAIQEDYEIKFRLYDGIEKDVSEIASKYSHIRTTLRNDGSVNKKVMSYFFEGLIFLIEADVNFWDGKHNEAYSGLQEALRMFTRFKNSRTVEARLDKLNERLINRVNGLIKLQDYQLTRDQKIKNKILRDALNEFNTEVSHANEMNETISSYASFSRASFTESRIYAEEAKILISSERTGEGKKSLFQTRYSLRQAAFIETRYQPILDDLEVELDELTKTRLLFKAEKMADIATEHSENGAYNDAKELFHKAVLFHRRASGLASDAGSRRKLLSSATLYEASILEAEGNQLFKIENNTELAAEKYEEASKFVEKAIALMGHFGSEILKSSFICQSTYYKAKSLQTKGISEFDKENYKDAKQFLDESSMKFKDAMDLANKSDNYIIVQLGNEAIGDNNGYLSIVDALL